MAIKEDAMIIGGAVALIGLTLWWAKGKVGEVVDAALPYVNPADSNNIVNQAVTWVGSAATGEKSWSLGTWLYDMVHGTENLDIPLGPTKLNIPNANGWQYFSNGVAISPDGKYYQGGQLVWAP